MSITKIKAAVSGIIAKIPEDKRKHFIVGFAIAAVVSLPLGYLIGIASAVVIGAAKEAYDHLTGKGTPEVKDFIATALGAVCFTAFSVVVTLTAKALF